MELVKYRSNTVEFEGDREWTVTATWEVDGTPKGALVVGQDEDDPDIFFAKIPYVEKAPVKVTWTFVVPGSGTHTKTDTYSVGTPYLTIRQVQTIVPDLGDDLAADLERSVRMIIDNYCGQSFGSSEKTLYIPGTGNWSLRLPERLVSFTDISSAGYSFNTQVYTISGSGWNLNLYNNELETVKQMPSEVSLDAGPVFITPYTTWYRGFHPLASYAITGVWGWESVPKEVVEAAKLLIAEYGCQETAYRDKFLKSMKSADWRMDFSAESWERTGHVRADQLLAPYVVWDWGVV